MSSDSEEDDFVIYGSALEPLNEDAIPKKRAVTVEDQVAKDKYGRRRFHGAFTGGFSAGFYNSVGSLEGWKPSQFKSSRSFKSQVQEQKPEDFMDDEDMDEFGIAPKTIRPTSNYNLNNDSSSRKRAIEQSSSGPIPGTPVLKSLIEPVRETIGIRLLVKMGWRPGQGVGPRQSAQEKILWKKQQKSKRVYGCALPVQEENSLREHEESEEDEYLDPEVTFAPDDFDSYIVKPKDDCFGLGYSGLDRRPVLSTHLDLFGPANKSSLVLKEKKKKVNIRGQAFGVGAFEEEDGDIYAKEDMSQYDFALDTPQMLAEKRKKERKAKSALALPSSSSETLEGFVLSATPVVRKQYPPPPLPPGFTPRHQHKPSRFSSTTTPTTANSRTPTPQLSATERAAILNSGQETEKPKIPEVRTPVTNISTFRPFVSDPDKQERYEKFLTFSKNEQADSLKSIQPQSMTEWERERERSEFEQAAKMYRPLSAAFSDRFVTASLPDDSTDPLAPVARTASADDDIKNATKLKMFGHLTRRVSEWEPHSILCKRFNIPQPGRTGNSSMKSKSTRPKFSVFNFLDAPTFNEAHSSNSVESNITTIKMEPDTDTHTPLETAITSSNVVETDSSRADTEQDTVVKMEVESHVDDIVEQLADATNKIDLYRAIFLSESDESDQDESSQTRVNNIKQEATAAEQNTLRNTSPPRGIFANLNFDTLNAKPSKPSQPQETSVNENNAIRKPSPSRDSFFANLTFDVSNSSDAKSESKRSSELQDSSSNKKEDTSLTTVPDGVETYGPALPMTSHKVHKRLVPKLEPSDSEEDWVELNGSSDSESNKQSTHKKKHKKRTNRKSRKHKEKKHKHKKKKK